MLPFTMPRHYENENDTTDDEANQNKDNVIRIHHWKPLLLFTYFYYVISCGIERIYQPMVKQFNLPLIFSRINSAKDYNLDYKIELFPIYVSMM